MCGDPPNIIVGTSLQLTFADFITNTGVLAGISLILVVIYYYLIFHKELRVKRTGKVVTEYPDPKSAITNKTSFAISTVIFLCAVVLLVTHAQTGLTVATIGLGIAIVTLITSGKNVVKVIKGVDYKTLLFFIGLFVVVGGLEQTHVLKLIAEFIGKVSGGNLYVMVAIIIWISAVASAFVDNIPFAATMVPVIQSLAALNGVNISTLAWGLSMGTDIGGSATPIGASANVVGMSVIAKEGHIVGWGKYCKSAVPATIIVMVVATVGIWLRYC